MEALASTTKDLEVDEMIGLVLKAGEVAVTTMATLDEANTTAYGNPEITEVNIGVGSRPGILISGHDLKDMEELAQTDRRHRCGCLYPRRNAAGQLLSGL